MLSGTPDNNAKDDTYTITVKGTDSGGLKATTTFTLKVTTSNTVLADYATATEAGSKWVGNTYTQVAGTNPSGTAGAAGTGVFGNDIPSSGYPPASE